MKQKWLLLDIETRPKLVYTFDLKDTTIALNAIVEDECILAWSVKPFMEPVNTIRYMDLRASKPPILDDKSILLPLHHLLQEADGIVTQNGKEFDLRKLNARFEMNGMRWITHLKHFDLYLLSRRVAAYTSQKLEYVTEKMNTRYKKLSHKRYPGLVLWIECLKGNREAWNEMKKYNIQDTLSTEERAMKLMKMAPKAWPDLTSEKCDSCGKVKTIKVKCQSCGKWEKK